MKCSITRTYGRTSTIHAHALNQKVVHTTTYQRRNMISHFAGCLVNLTYVSYQTSTTNHDAVQMPSNLTQAHTFQRSRTAAVCPSTRPILRLRTAPRQHNTTSHQHVINHALKDELDSFARRTHAAVGRNARMTTRWPTHY